MTDTPEHIKQLQHDIWLSKSPMERLLQFLQDNDTLYNFWEQNHTLLNTSPEQPGVNLNFR